ncbi:MAG: sigma 54-interacting transcriptional regulator [Verrucomicrobiales bacterium]|nr:sigma 54-interacting transcriptional regulator [Verrucomicrobiales bacterium]
MESAGEHRFDPNYAAQVLLDLAHEKSVDNLLDKLVRRTAARPNVACFQVWLIDSGDRCAACSHRQECPDTSRCLHLAAGRGTPNPGSTIDPRHYDDRSARMPLGLGLLGKVALTGEQAQVGDLSEHAEALVGFEWARQERLRSCGMTPIVFKGEVLGVIMGMTRERLPDETRLWGRIFADHVGAAIANARAFEEIERLKSQLEIQNAYLQEEVVEARAFGNLVGQSAALRQIVSQIDLVARTEASVLILGETGTGKELVAHEIHRRSHRREGPFVRVNCASIPRELFESEFFGHVKGAFTGAVKDRAGRFEMAAGGTLLLDEIADVPLELQAKLLRVLQERLYERVGEDRSRPADARIIAATNRDLKKEVTARRFREDLYYRLSVFPMHVAPLQERREDIPLLAKHFAELSARELRCPKPRLTRGGIAQLQTYDWPGNIRELRNVIERAVILARGGPLSFDLPTMISSRALPASAPTPGGNVSLGFLTEAEMQQRERANLQAALEAAGWKIKGVDGAAELMGLKPTTLVSRMKKFGLQRPGA